MRGTSSVVFIPDSHSLSNMLHDRTLKTQNYLLCVCQAEDSRCDLVTAVRLPCLLFWQLRIFWLIEFGHLLGLTRLSEGVPESMKQISVQKLNVCDMILSTSAQPKDRP